MIMVAEKKRIILMDDDPLIQSVTGRMIEVLGHAVSIVGNGEDLLDLYGKEMENGNNIDIVIMDLTIDVGMDAKEAMPLLLKLDPNASVIVSSGHAYDPLVTDFASFGFKGVLAKPFKLVELENAINSIPVN